MRMKNKETKKQLPRYNKYLHTPPQKQTKKTKQNKHETYYTLSLWDNNNILMLQTFTFDEIKCIHSEKKQKYSSYDYQFGWDVFRLEPVISFSPKTSKKKKKRKRMKNTIFNIKKGGWEGGG